MAIFFRYGEATPGGPEVGIPATDIQIPVNSRAVIRRIDAWSLAAAPGGTQFYINNTTAAIVTAGAPSHIWGAVLGAPGNVNTETFVFVDARAAAINVCASALSAALACGVAFSGQSN